MVCAESTKAVAGFQIKMRVEENDDDAMMV
jgi:hypothetical protein